MTKEIVHDCDDRMEKAVDVCKHELAKIHAGRATTALVDGVKVDSYGAQMPINQVATVNALFAVGLFRGKTAHDEKNARRGYHYSVYTK